VHALILTVCGEDEKEPGALPPPHGSAPSLRPSLRRTGLTSARSTAPSPPTERASTPWPMRSTGV